MAGDYDLIAEPRGISVAPWGDLIVTENDYGVVRIVRRKLVLAAAAATEDGRFDLSWQSMPSLNYRVEHSAELFAPDWRELRTVAGSPSNIVTSCVDDGVAPSRFYRVVEVP